MENSSRYLEARIAALRRLDRETLIFLLPPYLRLSGHFDLSKLDMVEIIVRERIIALL